MKRLLCALALLTLTGCHSMTFTGPNGTKAAVRSFGQRVTIGSATWGTNGVTVTNYNLDQVSALQAAFAAGLQAAKAAAVP